MKRTVAWCVAVIVGAVVLVWFFAGLADFLLQDFQHRQRMREVDQQIDRARALNDCFDKPAEDQADCIDRLPER